MNLVDELKKQWVGFNKGPEHCPIITRRFSTFLEQIRQALELVHSADKGKRQRPTKDRYSSVLVSDHTASAFSCNPKIDAHGCQEIRDDTRQNSGDKIDSLVNSEKTKKKRDS